jgi:hypothetical protein
MKHDSMVIAKQWEYSHIAKRSHRHLINKWLIHRYLYSQMEDKITASQQSSHVGYTSSHSNTEVKQHWTCIVLGWETLQIISGSAGTPKGILSNASISFFHPCSAASSKKQYSYCHT